MMRVLVLIDGSEIARRVTQLVMKQASLLKAPPDIHLLNVQHPLPGTVTGVGEQARQFHNEEGQAALAGACQLLDEAKLKYTCHIIVGEISAVVAQATKEFNCDQIIMGTRGMGTVANMLLGSVATKVLHVVDVPVLFVK